MWTAAVFLLAFAARAPLDEPASQDRARPAPVQSPEQGPGIGEHVPRFTFTDTRWLTRTLDDFGAKKAIAIVFTALDCPVAKRTMPKLAEMEKRWRARGVQFLAIDVGAGDALVEIAARAVEQGLEFPVARDFTGEALRALRPERTPEVVVLDGDRAVRYRGRVDALERVSGTSPSPASGSVEIRRDLEEALEDVLAGRAVRVSTTPVEGCRITAQPARATPARTPTFADDVAPLLHARCGACHVDGGAGPFELVTYAGASKHAAMIAEVVERGRMPPWFASGEYGEFENRRALDDDERALIRTWAEGGAPSGDLSRAPVPPKPRVSETGWRIGEPDLVVSMISSEKLPATGRIPYKYVVLPHVFLGETWVEAVEIRPSNRKVLHHANLGWWQLGSDVKSSNFITGEVPGGDPMILEPGTAVRIPAGALIGLQIHYVPTGREEEDRISVGLRFPRGVVHKELRHHEIANHRFEIPPFAPAFPVVAKRTFDVDAIGIGMYVHMHLRGRDMRFMEHDPDGKSETLLLVPNYDFDWQQAYRWKSGARVFPKGSSVECVAHFDNSTFNPWNPEPSKAVKFGQETTDEMMYGFLFYVARDQDLNLRVDPANGQAVAR